MFVSCFSWLTQTTSFPADVQKKIQFHTARATETTESRTARRTCVNRGNTDALRSVKYPVHRTGKLFTGLRPDKFRAQLVLQAGDQGLAAWSGSAVMSALTSVSSSQPVQADTATTGCTGRNSRNTAPFSHECSVPVREKAECRPYPIHGRAPFCRPASPQTAPADVPGAGCVARNTHPQTGHGHRL